MLGPEDLDADDLNPEVVWKTARGMHGRMVEFEQLRPFPELVRERQAQSPGMALTVYLSATGRIQTDDTPTLLMRLDTTEDPAVAWLIHCELTTRGVPPVLRPCAPENSRQMEILRTVADLQWIAHHHRDHEPSTPRADRLFTYVSTGEQWGRLALQVYRWNHGRAYLIAGALNLTDDQRQQLDTMPNRKQAATRKALRKARDRIATGLMTFAIAHPDKAGKTTADAAVERQMRLLRVHVLTGCNASVTADCMTKITGKSTSRQLVRQQIDRIKQRSGAAERLVV